MAQTHFDIEIKRGSGSYKNGWAAGLYTGKWDEGLRFATMTDAMYLNQDEQEYRVGFLKGVAFSKSGPPCDCAVVSLRESVGILTRPSNSGLADGARGQHHVSSHSTAA
jgi:hypothetical protein